MDRHNALTEPCRVELPRSLRWSAFAAASETLTRSRLAGLLGRLGLLTSTLAVILTASMLALRAG